MHIPLLIEKGLTKDVEFYLQFFKYGCPPHGGFAIGVDRFNMLLLGLSIKEYNKDMAISEFEEFISDKKEEITDIDNLDDDE